MESKKTIRVILADDHPLIRQGVRKILEKTSDIIVVGEAATGAAALRLVQELRPDVILLDIEMPDMKGTQVAWELRRRHVPVSIVILSACDDSHFIEETLKIGADIYLNKSEPPARIREAIRWVSIKSATILPLLFFLLSNTGLTLFHSLNGSLLNIT